MAGMEEKTIDYYLPILADIYARVHRNHETIVSALQIHELSQSMFYKIPREVRDQAEALILAEIEDERNQFESSLKTLRQEIGQESARTVLEAMPKALIELMNIMTTSKSEWARLRAVEVFLELSRTGVILPLASDPLPEEFARQLPPPDVQPTFARMATIPLPLPTGNVSSVTVARTDGSTFRWQAPAEVDVIIEGETKQGV
jgi:hypothetical protein